MAWNPVRVIALLLLLASGAAAAQVAIPQLGSRGGEPAAMEPLIASFTGLLRDAVAQEGLEVTTADLITPGIAGSLDPEYARLIADLDGARYAVSAEIAVDRAGGAYLVNLIVVDAEQNRATDLMSRSLTPESAAAVARSLARSIALFAEQAEELPEGDAGLFISSQPVEAEVYLNGVRVGTTPSDRVHMLAPGRYRLELRKEGFLPEARTVELRSQATTFEHVPLAPLSGGSILVESIPSAQVYLEGELQGSTPLFIPAPPGIATVRLSRPGFEEASASVPVRNYRTSRVEVALEPASSRCSSGGSTASTTSS